MKTCKIIINQGRIKKFSYCGKSVYKKDMCKFHYNKQMILGLHGYKSTGILKHIKLKKRLQLWIETLHEKI